ncbi:MAG: hypothetical protein CL927_19695 [Deltaproteobacteria bacterium]|nr:hypothetical protein [Deltaproteobacteria bacterium]
MVNRTSLQRCRLGPERLSACAPDRGPEPAPRTVAMDERQSRWLVLLSAVLAVLVLGIVFLEPPTAERDGDRRWEGIADGRTVDQVTGMNLTLDGNRIRVVREGASWRWVEPVDVPAEGSRIDALLRSVLDLQAGEPIDVLPERVGLGDSSPVIALEVAERGDLVVRIGQDAPVGSASYIQLGQGAVRASRTRIRSALPQTLTDLREPTLASFPRSEVKRVMIQAASTLGSPIFERDVLGWWRTDLDPRVKASESAVHTLIDTIRFTKAQTYLDAMPPLQDSDWIVAVSWGDPTEEAAIQLKQRPDASWNASGPNHPGQVLLAGGELAELLQVDGTGWADTRLVGLRPTLLERLVVRLDGVELDTQRTADGWSDPRATAILVALETGEAVRGSPTPAPNGPPSGRIEVHQGGEVLSLTVHQATDAGDRVATEAGTSAPYIVTSGTLQAVAEALSQ